MAAAEARRDAEDYRVTVSEPGETAVVIDLFPTPSVEFLPGAVADESQIGCHGRAAVNRAFVEVGLRADYHHRLSDFGSVVVTQAGNSM